MKKKRIGRWHKQTCAECGRRWEFFDRTAILHDLNMPCPPHLTERFDDYPYAPWRWTDEFANWVEDVREGRV